MTKPINTTTLNPSLPLTTQLPAIPSQPVASAFVAPTPSSFTAAIVQPPAPSQAALTTKIFLPTASLSPAYSIVPFKPDDELMTASKMAMRAIGAKRCDGQEAARCKALLRTARLLETNGNIRGAQMLHRILFARGYNSDKTLAVIDSLNTQTMGSIKEMRIMRDKGVAWHPAPDEISKLFASFRLRGMTLQDLLDIVSVGGGCHERYSLDVEGLFEKLCIIDASYKDRAGHKINSEVRFTLEIHDGLPFEIHNLSAEFDPKFRKLALATHLQLALCMFMKRQGIRDHVAQFSGEGCLSWTAMGARIAPYKMAMAKKAVIELVGLGIMAASAVGDVNAMSDKNFARLKISRADVLEPDKFEVWLNQMIIRPAHSRFDQHGNIMLGITALSKTGHNVVTGKFEADLMLETLFGGYVEKKLKDLAKLADSLREREAYLAAISSHNALAKYYSEALAEYRLLTRMPPPIF